MTARGSPAVECRDVAAGGTGAAGDSPCVLEGVTFSVPRGDRLLLVGRSGSGKTTLLRLLNRLDEPRSGVILVGGIPITEQEPRALRRRVALLMQKPVVFAGTVRDNLLVRPHGHPPLADAKIAGLLADVGLSGLDPERDAGSLSGGEQQRLCLARALATEPEVLLLDEPTSALDPHTLGVIAGLVLEVQRQRALTLIVATHQAELSRRLDCPALLVAGGTARPASSADLSAFFGQG